jgi:Tfp pilus assembly pilus retraction ATPase PilT
METLQSRDEHASAKGRAGVKELKAKDQFPADQQAQVRSVLGDVLRGIVAQTLCRKIGGGRIAALEILVVNFAIANLIREFSFELKR